MEIQKIFSDYEGEERLYSVLMNEDELYIYQELFSDHESDDLNYTDRIGKFLAKNPLTIKAVRSAEKDILSTDRDRQKRGAKTMAKIGAIGGGVVGGLGAAALTRNPASGVVGAGIGAGIGAAHSYISGRVGSKIDNEIRRSGGGGRYDDRLTRRADLLAVADGEMSKAEFKKKWYRNKDAK